jgi:hypothetical protein
MDNRSTEDVPAQVKELGKQVVEIDGDVDRDRRKCPTRFRARDEVLCFQIPRLGESENAVEINKVSEMSPVS